MIPIWDAYKRGFGITWHYNKMVLLIYAANLFLAYLAMIPVANMLDKSLDYSTAAGQMLEAFDITLFSVMWSEYGKAINIGGLIFTFSLIYVVLNTFFAGGIFYLVDEDLQFSFSDFFKGCILYFKRFIKIFFVSLFFIVMALLLYLILTIIFDIFTKDPVTEFWPFTLFVVKVFILICYLAFVNMFFDYVKIIVVYNDFYRIFQTIKFTVMFIMMNMMKTIRLYGLYFLTAIALLCIYLFVQSHLEVTGAVSILIFIIISQLYMLARIFIRLSFFTGQYTYFKYSNTAMPGMSREMMDEAVRNYETRNQEEGTEKN
jgi:hypothetical protein